MTGPPATPNSKQSWTLLFTDLSFRNFIAPSVISVVYGLAMVLGALAVVVNVLSWIEGGIAAIFYLVIGCIVYLLWLAIVRVVLEVVMVIFRISEQLDSNRSV